MLKDTAVQSVLRAELGSSFTPKDVNNLFAEDQEDHKTDTEATRLLKQKAWQFLKERTDESIPAFTTLTLQEFRDMIGALDNRSERLMVFGIQLGSGGVVSITVLLIPAQKQPPLLAPASKKVKQAARGEEPKKATRAGVLRISTERQGKLVGETIATEIWGRNDQKKFKDALRQAKKSRKKR